MHLMVIQLHPIQILQEIRLKMSQYQPDDDLGMKGGVQTLEEIRLKIEKLLGVREVTLANLRSLKKDIEESYDKSRKARIAGTTATITGSVLGIVGFGLGFVTFGASMGPGVTILATIIGTSGGVTRAGAEIVYQVVLKGKLEDANHACSNDRKLMEELGQIGDKFLILLSSLAERYTTKMENKSFAPPVIKGAWNTYRLINGFADTGHTIKNACTIKTAVNVAHVDKVTAWAGFSKTTRVLGVVGVVLNAVSIPVDLAGLLNDIHKGTSASECAASVQKLIRDLEKHRDILIAAQKMFTSP